MPTDATVVTSAERFVPAPVARIAAAGDPHLSDRVLLDALPMGMLLTDAQGRCLDANPAALSLLEQSRESLIGRNISEYLAEVGELMIDGTAGHADAGELRIRRPNGSELVIELSVTALRGAGEPATVYFFREISDEIALAEQLRETARTDALTRLPNRYALEQQVDVALRTINRGGPAAIICFIDLDNFKSVNDTCGHAAGDALLRMVADVFRQRTRATDAVGRIGGDEFALLLNGCHLEDAIRHIETLRRLILDLDFSWQGRNFQVGLSAGLALLTPATVSVADALAEADMACFAAKSAGRSQTRVFTERLRAAGAALSADVEIAQRLRALLASGGISLNAQPLRALQTGGEFPPAREVLIRVSDRDGKLIPPRVLLPVASRFGLAREVDRWVVEHILHWLDRHRTERPNTRLYVNITVASLVDGSFVEFIERALWSRDGSVLGIEIPEQALMLHADAALRTIRALHAIGCTISIDRLSGRADALEMISGLPVSLMKLGPEFSTMTSVEDVTYLHAEAMVRIAHRLSRAVAVTAIETAEALHCARHLGAELAQGVAIAPAAPLVMPA